MTTVDTRGVICIDERRGTAAASDVVITMGCGDTCPVFPGKRYLDWQLEDPAGLVAELLG